MTAHSANIPRITIQSIGGSLLLMALFTMMWTGIAQGGLAGQNHYLVLIFIASLSVTFVGCLIVIIHSIADDIENSFFVKIFSCFCRDF